jgi:hypothetical protein
MFKLSILSGAAASAVLFLLIAQIALAPKLGWGEVSLETWYQQPLAVAFAALLAISLLSGVVAAFKR